MASAGLVLPPLAVPRYRKESATTAAVIATDDPENGRENLWLMITPTYKGSSGLGYISKAPAKMMKRVYSGKVMELGSLPKINVLAVGDYSEGTTGFPASKMVS